jgi:hypothetical protein
VPQTPANVLDRIRKANTLLAGFIRSVRRDRPKGGGDFGSGVGWPNQIMEMGGAGCSGGSW